MTDLTRWAAANNPTTITILRHASILTLLTGMIATAILIGRQATHPGRPPHGTTTATTLILTISISLTIGLTALADTKATHTETFATLAERLWQASAIQCDRLDLRAGGPPTDADTGKPPDNGEYACAWFSDGTTYTGELRITDHSYELTNPTGAPIPTDPTQAHRTTTPSL